MKCLKVDLRKVDFKQTATWNVWKQFGIDLNTTKKKYDVTEHYMPQEEQDKLAKYLIKNHAKMKHNVYKYMSKSRFEKSLAWEILGYFPSAAEPKKVRTNENRCCNT